MKVIKNNQVPTIFETLYQVLSSQRFLQKQGLGGEIPFFIQSFPIQLLVPVEQQIQSLIKRLESSGIDIVDINLYQICIEALQEKNLLNKIFQIEKQSPKDRFLKSLNSSLNINTVLLPIIRDRIAAKPAKIIFLNGIGAAFPFVRSHTILNNLQAMVNDIPLVMFFPGEYNNQSLTLFNQLKDDNYYRAHNLNEYQ